MNVSIHKVIYFVGEIQTSHLSLKVRHHKDFVVVVAFNCRRYYVRTLSYSISQDLMFSQNDATWSSQGREWAGFLNVEIGGVKGKYLR